MPTDANVINISLVLIALIFAFLLIPGFLRRLTTFLERRRYINMEINRNTGEEQAFWLAKKRRLWRIFLPFTKY